VQFRCSLGAVVNGSLRCRDIPSPIGDNEHKSIHVHKCTKYAGHTPVLRSQHEVFRTLWNRKTYLIIVPLTVAGLLAASVVLPRMRVRIPRL
jgi:hypothetical protein